MKSTTASEFKERLEEYLAVALHEAVVITKDDALPLVVTSYKEYKELRAECGIQESLHVNELSQADLKTISEARMPEGYEHLNDELED